MTDGIKIDEKSGKPVLDPNLTDDKKTDIMAAGANAVAEMVSILLWRVINKIVYLVGWCTIVGFPLYLFFFQNR